MAWGIVLGCELPSDVQAALEVGETFVEPVGLHAVFNA